MSDSGVADITARGAPETPEAQEKSHVSTVVSIAVGLGVLVLLTLAFLHPGGQHLRAGDAAPEFALELLDGTEVALSDLRGRVVVLNFWASWCTACRRETPALQATWEEYQDRGVSFVGVSYQDTRAAAQAFVDEFGVTYPNGIDSRGRIGDAYGITGVPETFVIDRDGTVAWLQIGEVGSDALSEQLERLLAK